MVEISFPSFPTDCESRTGDFSGTHVSPRGSKTLAQCCVGASSDYLSGQPATCPFSMSPLFIVVE
jgi:hypothetical protein